MLKVISLFLVLIAATNGFRDLTLTLYSGHIFQGINATGVNVKTNKGGQEIVWTETQDNLKVHLTKFFEKTKLVETLEIDNLCDKIKRGSTKESVARFILINFGNTNRCPIKKGTVKISFPVTFKFKPTEEDICGPFIAMVHIIKNSQDGSNTPLLISILYRGSLTGC